MFGSALKKSTLFLVVFAFPAAANAQWKVEEIKDSFRLGTTVSASAADVDGGGIGVMCRQGFGTRPSAAILIAASDDLGMGKARVRWIVDRGAAYSSEWPTGPDAKAAFSPKKRDVVRFINEVKAANGRGTIKYEVAGRNGRVRHFSGVQVGNAANAIDTALSACGIS